MADSETKISIAIASLTDAPCVAELLDQYRVFYKQTRDPDGALNFISNRIKNRESVIFVASIRDRGGAALTCGFAQLFPTFSSVRLSKCFVLNDLFVDPTARRLGVGAALLASVRHYAEAEGAFRIQLGTMRDNIVAQSLYESEGYTRDTHGYGYTLLL